VSPHFKAVGALEDWNDWLIVSSGGQMDGSRSLIVDDHGYDERDLGYYTYRILSVEFV
jgi:hypothetical protein